MARHFGRLNLRQLDPKRLESARTFYKNGASPAPLRRAATCVLLREAPLRVYLIRRAATMRFAGGLFAFPGGGLEPQDADVASCGIREVMEETGAHVALQRAWSRWQTPEFEPVRFDTWFYMATLSEGYQPRAASSECEFATWIGPEQALSRYGEQMMLPTASTLLELSRFTTVGEIFAAAEQRDMTPILPRVVLDASVPEFVLPGEPNYPTEVRA
ncbi:NUDIX hydrolase [Natronoglycomyces albus]|uniref:NUDIX hydrolase n=1 Tax=Natronoglycomyces albus TaxID=2811108 RepID=A0A895XRZ2_9ACTN|nr:NUDIX hydrolase [Natronoglycomyces albus]QSB05030.1 NUDIX hydrolase [Natronoglycomyces albus]